MYLAGRMDYLRKMMMYPKKKTKPGNMMIKNNFVNENDHDDDEMTSVKVH